VEKIKLPEVISQLQNTAHKLKLRNGAEEADYELWLNKLKVVLSENGIEYDDIGYRATGCFEIGCTTLVRLDSLLCKLQYSLYLYPFSGSKIADQIAGFKIKQRMAETCQFISGALPKLS